MRNLHWNSIILNKETEEPKALIEIKSRSHK